MELNMNFIAKSHNYELSINCCQKLIPAKAALIIRVGG